MEIVDSRKKRFIVIAQFDSKDPVKVLSIEAENHDVASHLVEIMNGEGSFTVCDKIQAQKIIKDIQNSLNS